MQNKTPDVIRWDPDLNGPNGGIKSGLQEAARRAYLKSKINPQLILVVLPVSFLPLNSMESI